MKIIYLYLYVYFSFFCGTQKEKFKESFTAFIHISPYYKHIINGCDLFWIQVYSWHSISMASEDIWTTYMILLYSIFVAWQILLVS